MTVIQVVLRRSGLRMRSRRQEDLRIVEALGDAINCGCQLLLLLLELLLVLKLLELLLDKLLLLRC